MFVPPTSMPMKNGFCTPEPVVDEDASDMARVISRIELIAPNKLNRQVAGGQAASTPRQAEISSEFLGVLRVLGGFIHSIRCPKAIRN
jgi:hypothetical protein